jgi:hypothetical protein
MSGSVLAAQNCPDSGPRGFVFMLATGAACRGRNALACAPSLPDDESADPGLSVDTLGGETEAAATLAGLAAVLHSRLAAAAEAHALFSGGGSR